MKYLCGLAFLVFPLAGQGVWDPRAPYPISATEVSSVAVGSKIYAMCGLTAQGASRALFIYDTLTDAWSEGAAIPIEGGADHCNVAAANGKVYLLGAIRIGSNFVDGNTYEYDPAADRWQQVARMNYPRGASGVAAIGPRIYVAGGLPGSVARFEVFDAGSRAWNILTDMPTPRDHLTAQAVNGKFYAIGGRNSRDVTANEEYDPASNSWRARAPLPTARGGLASGVIAGRIAVFGGEGNSGTPENTFRQNEEYNPASDTWRPLAPMLRGRHGFYGATSGSRIFAPSGGPRAGGTFSNDHEAFLLPPAEAPVIQAGGVRNAASFEGMLAPGMIASLFGSNLSQGEQIAARLPLGTSMNAVSVEVNGAPVPLFYVGPAQINFVVPESIPVGQASVTVTNAGSRSSSVSIAVTDRFPAIFSLNQSGAGQGAILIAGTGLIARATRDAFSRAAVRGDVVEIYGTGLGRTAGGLVEAPLVAIGNARAEVLFAGLAPGFVGLYQVNARVPSDAMTGIAVPVTWQIGPTVSNVVTMAVIE